MSCLPYSLNGVCRAEERYKRTLQIKSKRSGLTINILCA